MTSTSTGFTGARKLNAVKTLVGHEPSVEYMPDGRRIEDYVWGPEISYFPDGQKMISGYGDKTARLWDLEAGKEIEEARVVCEQTVHRVAVSRDSRWVIAACQQGELKACEVKTGVIKAFKGNSSWIISIDISRDSKLLVSGSLDGTTRIWDLEIGNLVASTSTSPHTVGAVRLSQDSRKLAVMSMNNLDVWDIEARKFDTKVRKICHSHLLSLPVFWTTRDRTIIAVFALDDQDPKTIYEIQSSTLEIVGAPFEGHTRNIHSLDLSLDCALLVSASVDNTINLWAFDSRQILASFDGQNIQRVVISPNARQVAYTSGPDRRKIYICDIPLDIIANLWSSQKTPGSNARTHRDPLNSDATARRADAQRTLVPAPFAARPLRRSPTTNQQHSEFSVLRHLRKLLPASFRMDDIRTVEPRDPLDCPATSSSQVPIANLIHSDPGENSRSTLPIPQPSTLASKTIISRLRHWRPAHTGHALTSIANVPLAQGQTRNAAAGAPRRHDSYVRDEDIDSQPPSRNCTSDRVSAEGHQSGRLCFCF